MLISTVTEHKVAIYDEAAEIIHLNDQLQILRDANEGLEATNRIQSTLLEEKTEDIIVLAEQLNITQSQLNIAQAKSDGSKTEVQTLIANLVEQLNINKVKSDEHKTEVKTLVAKNEDYVQRMAILVDDLAITQSRIDEMSETIQYKNELSEEKTFLIDRLTAENDELKTKVETLMQRMTATEDRLSAKEIMIEKMSEDITEKSQTLEEKSVTIDYFTAENSELTEQLQLSTAKSNCLQGEIESLVASNKEYVQQISVLEDDLVSKKNVIDEMSEDIENKRKEMSELIEQLQNSTTESDGLKKCVDALVASNNQNVQQLSVLESELMAKNNEINDLRDRIQHKSVSLDEESTKMTILSEQLHAMKSEIVGLKTSFESAAAINKVNVEQIAFLESDLAAKIKNINEKDRLVEVKSLEIADFTERLQIVNIQNGRLNAEVESLVANEKENAEQINLLKSQLATEKIVIEEMAADIDCQSKLLEEKSVENNNITKRLQISKAVCDELKAEVASLVSSTNTSAKQISLLEDDLVAKKLIINEMTEDNQQKIILLDEKSAEIVELTKRLELTITKKDAEIMGLHERQQMAKAESDRLKTCVDALVASNNHNVQQLTVLNADQAAKRIAIDNNNQQIKMLEDDLQVKKIDIDKMADVIQENSRLMKEKTAENVVLAERLQLSMTECDALKTEVESFVVGKMEYVQQVAMLEDNLVAMKSKVNDMNADIQQKSSLLEEKSAKIIDLTNHLQVSMAKNEELEQEVESLVARNETIVQQMTVLKDDLTTKMSAIDTMTADISEKRGLLDKKSTQIEDITKRLDISKAACDELKTEVESLIISNQEKVHVLSVLESELVAKTMMIDKLSEDITEKSQSLEEKSVTIEYFTAENSELTEQLQLSTAKSNCLQGEIESLVASNKEYVQQISVLEDDLAFKKSVNNEMREDIKSKSTLIEEKSAEIANLSKQLHTSNAENNGLKTEIESLVVSNNQNVKKLTSAIDRMSHDIQHKIALLDENSVEIAALSEQLNDSKVESYRLKVEIESLVASNDEKAQHITTLDSDLMVKKGAIDELSEEIQHKNVLLEAKTVKIAFLMERIHLSKLECDGLKEEVEALVARNDENALTLRLNEDVLLAKKITIDKMTEDIELKSTLLDEKEGEILDLMEQLQLTKAEKNRFVSEIESLMSSKKENVEILTTAIDGLTDDIKRKSKMLEVLTEQNNDLAEQLQRCKTESHELKTKVESLTAYKMVNVEQVALLEKDLVAKKVMIDELTKDIQHYRDHW